MLADSGIWYALFDSRDPYHDQTRQKGDYLDLFHVVLPWPILYETLCTRFVRNTSALAGFERYLKTPRITFLDDSPYRETAFDLSLKSSLIHSRPLSLVDCTIRLILDDINTKIDCLMTFNERDFVDVCRRRRIELI
jgi:predicted nucleic acid-binding protein